MKIPLTDDLRREYLTLFANCVVDPARLSGVNGIISRIMPNQARYQSVADPLGIPWHFVAVIHNMECSLNFTEHLHNGDPLTARTFHVPAGRPPIGEPPFRWEISATDALTVEGFANRSDWSLPVILYRLEAYNGFGYRNRTPPLNTPYLWSFSNHYTKGKFTKDGVFDPDAPSNQCGAAVILFQMAQRGLASFASAPQPILTPAAVPAPAMTADQLATRFDKTVTFSNAEVSDAGRALQGALNTFPGIQLVVDGKPGKNTSDAYQKVTGHFLPGDPRR